MKKFGFTLAEVLITLTIIGVIAAITLPSITANVQKKSIGPTLAKAINNLETSNRIIMQETGVMDLKSAIVKRVGADTNYYTELLETTLQGGLSNSNKTFTTKDGIAYTVSAQAKTTTAATPAVTALKDKYACVYWVVDIDTNGAGSTPNAPGYDQFKVYVDNFGAVIPYGGNEHNRYDTKTKVAAAKACSSALVNEACTGKIADDGWKVTY